MADCLVQCPFDPAHFCKRSRIQKHLVSCLKNHPETKKVPCPFNASEYIDPAELPKHLKLCKSAKLVEASSYTVEEKGANYIDAPFTIQGASSKNENGSLPEEDDEFLDRSVSQMSLYSGESSGYTNSRMTIGKSAQGWNSRMDSTTPLGGRGSSASSILRSSGRGSAMAQALAVMRNLSSNDNVTLKFENQDSRKKILKHTSSSEFANPINLMKNNAFNSTSEEKAEPSSNFQDCEDEADANDNTSVCSSTSTVINTNKNDNVNAGDSNKESRSKNENKSPSFELLGSELVTETIESTPHLSLNSFIPNELQSDDNDTESSVSEFSVASSLVSSIAQENLLETEKILRSVGRTNSRHGFCNINKPFTDPSQVHSKNSFRTLREKPQSLGRGALLMEAWAKDDPDFRSNFLANKPRIPIISKSNECEPTFYSNQPIPIPVSRGRGLLMKLLGTDSSEPRVGRCKSGNWNNDMWQNERNNEGKSISEISNAKFNQVYDNLRKFSPDSFLGSPFTGTKDSIAHNVSDSMLTNHVSNLSPNMITPQPKNKKGKKKSKRKKQLDEQSESNLMIGEKGKENSKAGNDDVIVLNRPSSKLLSAINSCSNSNGNSDKSVKAFFDMFSQDENVSTKAVDPPSVKRVSKKVNFRKKNWKRKNNGRTGVKNQSSTIYFIKPKNPVQKNDPNFSEAKTSQTIQKISHPVKEGNRNSLQSTNSPSTINVKSLVSNVNVECKNNATSSMKGSADPKKKNAKKKFKRHNRNNKSQSQEHVKILTKPVEKANIDNTSGKVQDVKSQPALNTSVAGSNEISRSSAPITTQKRQKNHEPKSILINSQNTMTKCSEIKSKTNSTNTNNKTGLKFSNTKRGQKACDSSINQKFPEQSFSQNEKYPLSVPGKTFNKNKTVDFQVGENVHFKNKTFTRSRPNNNNCEQQSTAIQHGVSRSSFKYGDRNVVKDPARTTLQKQNQIYKASRDFHHNLNSNFKNEQYGKQFQDNSHIYNFAPFSKQSSNNNCAKRGGNFKRFSHSSQLSQPITNYKQPLLPTPNPNQCSFSISAQKRPSFPVSIRKESPFTTSIRKESPFTTSIRKESPFTTSIRKQSPFLASVQNHSSYYFPPQRQTSFVPQVGKHGTCPPPIAFSNEYLRFPSPCPKRNNRYTPRGRGTLS